MALGDKYASIDLGSSSIKIIIASETEKGLEIDSYNEIASHGIVRGEIKNVEYCYKKLNNFINQYSKQVSSFKVNLSSISVSGFGSSSSINISSKITSTDIESAISACTEYRSALEQDKKIFVYPYSFKVNHNIESSHPIGIKANHLKVNYYLIHLNKRSVNNIYSTFEKTKFEIEDEIISSIALSSLVLSEYNKSSGVCLLDIGDQVCDLIIIKDNIIKLNMVIEFGGDDITENISYHYDCSKIEAERLKKDCGFININNTKEEILLDFKQDNKHKSLSNYQLAEVIKESYLLLLNKIKLELDNYSMAEILKSGFIVTGGGAKTDGFITLSRKILKNKVSFLNIDIDFLQKKNIYFKEGNIVLNKYSLALSLLYYKLSEDYLKPAIQPKLKNATRINKIIGFFKTAKKGIIE